jgi:hypothetical protein
MALFDLNAVTLELKAIDSEITRLAKQCCELKKKKKILTDKLQLYFEKNNHQGVIINEMTITTISKTKKQAIPKKEKEEQIKQLFSKFQLPEPIAHELQAITQASKQTVKQEIVIKKDKK